MFSEYSLESVCQNIFAGCLVNLFLFFPTIEASLRFRFRLFDQERNKQEVEKLERKKEIDLAKQIYLLRIGIHDKLEAALQVRKPLTYFFIGFCHIWYVKFNTFRV